MAGHSLPVLPPGKGDVSVATAALPKSSLWWLELCHWSLGGGWREQWGTFPFVSSCCEHGKPRAQPWSWMMWGDGKGSPWCLEPSPHELQPAPGCDCKPLLFNVDWLWLLKPAGNRVSLLGLIFPSCCWNHGGSWDVLCWAGTSPSWLVRIKAASMSVLDIGLAQDGLTGRELILFKQAEIIFLVLVEICPSFHCVFGGRF